VFVDINDVALDVNNINITEITSADYIYTSDLQGDNVYAPFAANVILQDDVRYMFCLNIYSTNIYPGYDGTLDYNTNFETYQQPINMLRTDGGQWYVIGYGTDQSPAISINFMDALSIGLVELPQSDIVAYPNPASEIVNIPHGKMEGNVTVTVIDIDGRIVETQNSVSCSNTLTVDVTSLPTGIYTLKLTYEDGTSEAIQVVVNR